RGRPVRGRARAHARAVLAPRRAARHATRRSRTEPAPARGSDRPRTDLRLEARAGVGPPRPPRTQERSARRARRATHADPARPRHRRASDSDRPRVAATTHGTDRRCPQHAHARLRARARSPARGTDREIDERNKLMTSAPTLTGQDIGQAERATRALLD